MQYHFICNPTAGKGNAKNAWLVIKDYLIQQHVNYVLHETQYIDHARIITQELTKNLQEPICVVSVGGDGTLCEVVNGVVNFEKTYLGIIPCGSGNDFVSATNIPKHDAITAVKYLLENKSRPIDYMIVNDVRAINVVGFGIDTDVLEDYYKRKHFGAKFRYKLSTIKCSLFVKMHNSEISVDDAPFQKVRTAMLTIGNGKNIGGGICVCPHAKIDDGILDFTIVESFPKWKTLLVLAKVMRRKILGLKYTKAFHCKKVAIKLNGNAYQYDGNIIKGKDTLIITIGKEKINLIG